MAAAFLLTWPHDDVALLTLDVPHLEANVLSDAVLAELAEQLQWLSQRDDLAGLIVRSGKPGSFAAGEDPSDLAARFGVAREMAMQWCVRAQEVLCQLSKMPFVTVAAIEGSCLGRGAELAAWCDRRLFAQNPHTEFGFPETTLGWIPGGGGTVRAPRIVGLAHAVEMICTGRTLDSQAAVRMGWGTAVVADDLLQAAIDLVREEQRTRSFAADSVRWSQPLPMEPTEQGHSTPADFAPFLPADPEHYPAPLAVLTLMLATRAMSIDDALAREAELWAELFGSPVNRALVNVAGLAERNRREVWNPPGSTPVPRRLRSMGIIGAGVMGAGIAAATVEADLPVVLMDSDRESLEKGARQAVQEASFDPSSGHVDADRAAKYAPLLKVCGRDDELVGADLILETVIESATVKRDLYARLEPQISPEAVIASNTSAIPITHLAKGLLHPERFCGIHFFNPVRRTRLVEIIRGAETNDETVATAVAYVKRIGRMPVVVNDGPGFLVNRLLSPYLNEAIELVLEGALPREIDRAAVTFGMPLGPIAVYDLIGIDTAFLAGRNFWMAFPDRVNSSPLLPALVKAGRLGQKAGRGFYSYDNAQLQAEDDPAILAFIDRYRRDSRHVTQEEIIHRLLLAMLLEATRTLDDNVAQDVRDIDLSLIFATGFPPFRGGLLFWADAVGLPTISRWLAPLEELGPRMQPTERFLEMERRGEKFYSSAISADAPLRESELERTSAARFARG